MQASIIIVNYKTKELAKDAIQSVFDKTEGIEYEIIVIDNDSKDGSVEYLINKFGNKIEVIDACSNLGFGKANNIGIRKANGKYIFLLNPDTKLVNNAVKIFYNYMELNTDVGACCGNLYDENMNPVASFSKIKPTVFAHLYLQYSYMIYITISKLVHLEKKIYNYFNYTNNIKDVGYVSGADMFIRKSVLDKSGLFDEDIFMYGDDIDLSCRISKSGFKLKSIPYAQIVHLESKSINNNKEKYRICLNGEYKFYFKTYGRLTILIYINYQLLDCLRMLLRIILPKFILKKYFLGNSSFEFYKERIMINKFEYNNVKFFHLKNIGNNK